RCPLVLRSFPTRRSSDLGLEQVGVAVLGLARVDLHHDVAGESALGQPLQQAVTALRTAPRNEVLVLHRPRPVGQVDVRQPVAEVDRKSTRLNSSHVKISY